MHFSLFLICFCVGFVFWIFWFGVLSSFWAYCGSEFFVFIVCECQWCGLLSILGLKIHLLTRFIEERNKVSSLLVGFSVYSTIWCEYFRAFYIYDPVISNLSRLLTAMTIYFYWNDPSFVHGVIIVGHNGICNTFIFHLFLWNSDFLLTNNEGWLLFIYLLILSFTWKPSAITIATSFNSCSISIFS